MCVCVCVCVCPMNGSSLASSVHGILQSRILEWVAIYFSRGSSNPGIKPRSPVLQVDSLPTEPPGKPGGLQNLMSFGPFNLALGYLLATPPLISSCLHLPLGTQGRKQRLEFCLQKWETEKPLCLRALQGPA